eukprot:NODE_2496_length_1161_cov_722.139265_g1946_i1.p1 GENE.NODE_2496_length_1161_cov_722.139265_g1946_i1~~NODE_2496_length_1161_cov_722.139265_g1946_i1.p1  ORF type:complete len:321 (-),score=70.91 NODE_2496_length_1161_cov_722.139265_g1946_i1:126-1088(-)
MFRTARALFGKALVIAEHNNLKLSPSTLAATQAATRFGDVTVLVAGKGCGSVIEEACGLKGVASVLTVDSAEYANGTPENFAVLVKKVQDAKKFSHVVAAHTAFGKSVIPRVAAVYDCQPIIDVIKIADETTFARPTYAGNAIATVKADVDPIKFVSVRPTSFEKATVGGTAAKEAFEAAGESGLCKWMSDEVDTSGKPDLATAPKVVSGGRGMKSGDNFKMLYELADKLGNCAVGATRAVVDAGFVANELQVGQTGKIVAPQLYVAVGLSGAIQHLAGMKDSKTIACINTDPEAPIFSVSDYGLEADLFEAVPKMTKLL